MALSDYLTSDEWDACFYTSIGQHNLNDFGELMHKTIDKLIETGYKFEGLDEKGDRKIQIPNTKNGEKLCMFLGNPYNIDPLKVADNGRNFLKTHCPELVNESDEEWEKIINEIKEENK